MHAATHNGHTFDLSRLEYACDGEIHSSGKRYGKLHRTICNRDMPIRWEQTTQSGYLNSHVESNLVSTDSGVQFTEKQSEPGLLLQSELKRS